MTNVPPPERAGAAVRVVRRTWSRRLGRVAMWGGAALFALVIGLPAMVFAWGAVHARIDVERGRARIYGFGLPDPSGPVLDGRCGLRWRSLGCSVDPVSEIWCEGYNLVARNAAERGECASQLSLFRTMEDAEAAFTGGGVTLPVGAEVPLTESVVIAVSDAETEVRFGDRHARWAWQFHPDFGALSATLEDGGQVVFLRVVGVGGKWIDGVEHDWVRYRTYDSRNGECLQDIRH